VLEQSWKIPSVNVRQTRHVNFAITRLFVKHFLKVVAPEIREIGSQTAAASDDAPWPDVDALTYVSLMHPDMSVVAIIATDVVTLAATSQFSGPESPEEAPHQLHFIAARVRRANRF